jgi:hypothetical protein
MSSTNKFKYPAFVSPVGTAVYPYLITPDIKHDPDGVFKVDVSVPKELAEDFVATLEGTLDQWFKTELNTTQQKTLAKKPVFNLEYSRPEYPEGDITEDERQAIRAAHEPMETGNLLFRCKMKAKFTTRKGEIYEQQPIVVDADTGARITDSVWTGSTIRVKGQIVPYTNAAAQVAGLSLRMKAVQVIDLVTGEGGSAGFWTDFDEAE